MAVNRGVGVFWW